MAASRRRKSDPALETELKTGSRALQANVKQMAHKSKQKPIPKLKRLSRQL